MGCRHLKVGPGLKFHFQGAHGHQVAPGCQWELLVPLHVGLSTGLLGHSHIMATGFPEGAFQETQQKLQCFYALALGVMQHHFCDSIGHGVKASYPRAWIPGSEDQLSQPGDGCQILAQELGSSYSIHFLQDGGTFYVCYHLQDCCVVQLQGLGWHPSMCALLSCVTEQPTGEPL